MGQNMNTVEQIESFARFQAARAATDLSDIDLVVSHNYGSTDLYVAHPFWELSRTFFSVPARGVPTTASAEIESAPDEAHASDFDILDELRTPKGQLQRQIMAFRRGGEALYREYLALRLEILLDALEDEGENWNENSPDSLRQMLLFLQATPDLWCPTVTVTPSATFRAQWQVSPDKHFAVDFLPDGQVRFVVFSPAPRHADRVQRVSGVVDRADVMRAIEPYKVLRWAADART
jgi:hypothetical protein